MKRTYGENIVLKELLKFRKWSGRSDECVGLGWYTLELGHVVYHLVVLVRRRYRMVESEIGSQARTKCALDSPLQPPTSFSVLRHQGTQEVFYVYLTL